MLTRALSWSTLGAVLGMLVQLLVLAWLSRLLGASAFGLMASAMLAMRFVSYFLQLGLGPALIQREKLVPAHHTAAVLMALLVAVLCWLLLLALAPLAAAYFREPALVPVMRALPLVMGLGALAAVPQALLRRAMRFKALAGIDLVAVGLGYGLVSGLLALQGYGVWSLVLGMLAQQGLLLLFCLTLARPAWGRPVRQHFTDLLAYGGSYSLVGFLDFLSSNVETLFIGRFLGTERLGVYNRAQAISTLPVDQFMAAVNRVMFPALAAIRHDRVALTRALVLSLKLSALLTFPIATGLCLLNGLVVRVALGDGWAQAAPVLALLAWSIPATYLSTFIGLTFDSLALFRLKTALIVSITLLKVGLMLAVNAQGLVSVVVTLVVAEWLRVVVGVGLLRRRVALPWRQLALALLRGAVAAAAVVAVLWPSGLWLASLDWPPVLLLLLQVLLVLAVLLPVLRHLLVGVVAESEAQGADCSGLRRLARL